MVAAPDQIARFAAEASRNWLSQCLEAWRPRERLGGWEWADRERVLSREESPSPGPWRSLVWQRAILDALADPTIDWIVILKAAQMGVSEIVRCAVGRWALLDPGDVLWVVTTEAAAKKAMKKLRAMFRSTPALRPLVSSRRTDRTLLELVLTNGMRIVIGWAGSAQSLASDPFRYVILDEVAKYKWSVQGEGSAVDLAKERTKVYGRRGKIVLLSSPKDENDLIVTNHAEVADRRVFAVPCPACGDVQPIDWAAVRWPGGEPATAPTEAMARVRLADQVEGERSAWVACRACADGKLLPHRAAFDGRARWVQEEEAPRSRRVAFHVPEFFHWETTLSDLVAKWLRCTKPRALQAFHNGSLGLPYRSERGALQANLFQRRAVHEDGLVPSWATAVLATADTQIDHFWFMVRAWGPGGRSRLLDWGKAGSFDELEARTLKRRFPIEGRGESVGARFLLIDSGGGMETTDGSRTHDVYKFAKRVAHVLPIKGAADKNPEDGRPVWATKVEYTPAVERAGAQRVELELYHAHTEYWKDTANATIRADAPVLWEESQSAAAPDYGRHLTGEHRVMLSTPGGETSWRWQPRSKHARHDLWDCAWMQLVAAEIARVDGEAPIARRLEAKVQRKKKARETRDTRRARLPDGRPYHVGRR
jgi:phage terminase large subunit GpA-like protein